MLLNVPPHEQVGRQPDAAVLDPVGAPRPDAGGHEAAGGVSVGVDAVLLDVARVNGLSLMERLFRVVLPAALPLIFAGVRIALSIALVMMVISELIAADDGLGFYILRNQRLFQTANVYAGVLTIGTIGLALTLALLAIERSVLSWHRGWRGLSGTGSVI